MHSKETGDFCCRKQGLTTLIGLDIPENIERDFICSHNMLTNLEGSPQTVQKLFSCENNCLTTLKGAPEHTCNFNCTKNKLTNLEGAPHLCVSLICKENLLTSLKGCPQEGLLFINCDDNPDLEDISDLPACCNEISIKNCSKIKNFPHLIEDQCLKIKNPTEEVAKRLLASPLYSAHPDPVDDEVRNWYITIYGKRVGHILLDEL